MLKNRLKKFRANSLKNQLLYRIVAIMLLLVVLLTAFQYNLQKKSFYSSAEHLLESRLHNIEIDELIQTNTGAAVKQKASELINRMIDTHVSVLVIDKDGTIIAESENERRSVFGERLLKEEDETDNLTIPTPKLSSEEYIGIIRVNDILEGYQVIENPQGEKFMVAFTKLGDPDDSSGLVQLSTSLQTFEMELAQHILWSAIAAFIILLLGVAFISSVLNQTLRPLYDMTGTFERISAEKLNVRLEENNTQIEIDKLARASNEMLERIELSFLKEAETKETMRRFISNASHELKTPITSIHGFAEVLSMGAAKDEQQLQTALNNIMSESNRLNRLINNLLLLSRFDQSEQVEMKNEQLDEIIEELKPQLDIIAGADKVKLDISQPLGIAGNRDQIKQVLLNLVQNAVSYTSAENREIKITLQAVMQNGNPYGELIVQDNGVGIPKESLAAVFDRFYRVESHRSRHRGGYGLGLSIVKEIIDNHGGEIQVISEPGKGTSFYLYFRTTA